MTLNTIYNVVVVENIYIRFEHLNISNNNTSTLLTVGVGLDGGGVALVHFV